MPDTLGYARVSTGDQDVVGQTMRLTQAGAIKVFTDVRSGRNIDRPGLQDLLAYFRRGDTLAVVRLDRLGRSLGELLATVTMLKERGIALLSLGGEDRHVLGRRRTGLPRVRRHRPLRAPADCRAHQGRHRGGPRQREAPWPPTAGCRAHCSGAEAGRGRAVAHRRCAPARPGTLHRLSRGQPRRGRAQDLGPWQWRQSASEAPAHAPLPTDWATGPPPGALRSCNDLTVHCRCDPSWSLDCQGTMGAGTRNSSRSRLQHAALRSVGTSAPPMHQSG